MYLLLFEQRVWKKYIQCPKNEWVLNRGPVNSQWGAAREKKPSKTCVWELLVTDAREIKIEVNDLKFPLAFA